MSLAPVASGHALLAAALCFALSAAAAADEPGGSADLAATPAKPVAPTGPLVLWVEAHGEAFDRVALQESLARELGRDVAFSDEADKAAVQVRLDGAAHAAVRYTTPSGELLSRTIDLPPDGKRAAQVVSWLTVNLVRDEAGELLDELRARRKEEAEARAAADKAAADKAAADKAAADKAAADKAAAGKAAADKAAAEAAPKTADPNARAGRSQDELLRDPLRSFDAALATPLSLLRDSPQRVLRLQLALAYGESGAVEGATAAMGLLRIRRDLRGLALAGVAASVGGRVRGVVLGGAYSQIDGNLEGLQMGAVAAVQRGQLARGALLSVGGVLAGNVTGVMGGGAFATAKSLRGAAGSAGATIIRGPSEGVLLGAGANVSLQHRGFEASAGVNLARDLEGVAIAPINVHRRVKGLQIGVVNVAEEVDGAAIGIVSIAKNGRIQPVLWGTNDGSLHVAIKSRVGYVFTELGSGIDLKDDEFSYDGGVGAHLRLGSAFFFEPSVHYSASHRTADAAGSPDAQQLHYLAQVGLRVGDKLDLLAAVGMRHTIVGGSGAAVAPEARAGLAFF